MKRIAVSIILLIAPAIAFADPVKRNESQTTMYATEGDTGPHIAVDRYGNGMCTLAAGTAAAANPIKLEDSAHTSGDAGIPAFGIRNDAIAVTTGTDLDYQLWSLNNRGVGHVDLIDGTTSAWKAEDQASADAAAVFVSGFVAESALTQNTNASSDYTWGKTDLAGRQVVTGAPSGSMVVGCNTAVTTATTGTMIGAVASNFTFITSWNCTNTGATASRVILEDGDGTDLANLFLAATTGSASVTFPTPVRTNVVNKAIQVNVITSGSSTICCASGYTGVI